MRCKILSILAVAVAVCAGFPIAAFASVTLTSSGGLTTGPAPARSGCRKQSSTVWTCDFPVGQTRDVPFWRDYDRLCEMEVARRGKQRYDVYQHLGGKCKLRHVSGNTNYQVSPMWPK